MKLIKVMGRLSQLDEVISSCCIDGYFHPDSALQYVTDADGFSPITENNQYADMLHKIDDIASGSEIKLEMLDNMPENLKKEEIDGYLRKLENELGNLQKERDKLVNAVQTDKNSISQFEHFVGLNLKLGELFSCKFIKIRFGHMPKESLIKLDIYSDNPYLLFIPCSSDEMDTWGVYFSPVEKAEEVDKIFSSLYFERMRIPDAAGTPEEAIAEIQKHVEELTKQIAEFNKKISAYWNSEIAHCNEVYTYLLNKSTAFSLRRYAISLGNYFYFVGWVPASDYRRFKKAIKNIDLVDYVILNPEKSNVIEPPVKLKNNKLFRPYEYFVEMYGLPSYDEVDPTPFFAITYTIIFGIMFGDLGQGFVLWLCGFLLWKYKKAPLGSILTRCGVSACVFGVIYGSVFGFEHALNPFYKTVFGLSNKPIEVMESNTINRILIFSIAVGIGLLIMCMIINVYSNIRRKKFGEALFSHNGVAGIVFYGSAVYAVVCMTQGKKSFTLPVALCVFIIPLVLMLFKDILGGLIERRKDWKPESFVDYFLQSFFEVFEDVLSYISNTISFLRVGAFVLVHAGMMMVVFSLAGTGNIIADGIIIILGNVLVICLEGLLTGIQVLRLEFYEMFSHFFEGEGKTFAPVSVKALSKNS